MIIATWITLNIIQLWMRQRFPFSMQFVQVFPGYLPWGKNNVSWMIDLVLNRCIFGAIDDNVFE